MSSLIMRYLRLVTSEAKHKMRKKIMNQFLIVLTRKVQAYYVFCSKAIVAVMLKTSQNVSKIFQHVLHYVTLVHTAFIFTKFCHVTENKRIFTMGDSKFYCISISFRLWSLRSWLIPLVRCCKILLCLAVDLFDLPPNLPVIWTEEKWL